MWLLQARGGPEPSGAHQSRAPMSLRVMISVSISTGLDLQFLLLQRFIQSSLKHNHGCALDRAVEILCKGDRSLLYTPANSQVAGVYEKSLCCPLRFAMNNLLQQGSLPKFPAQPRPQPEKLFLLFLLSTAILPTFWLTYKPPSGEDSGLP